MKNAAVRRAFMNSVAQIAFETAAERGIFRDEHNQLMKEDSHYSAAFRKYEELLGGEDANRLGHRLAKIEDTSVDKPLRDNFLVCAACLKHAPLFFKLKQCEKQIMESFDRKFGQELS